MCFNLNLWFQLGFSCSYSNLLEIQRFCCCRCCICTYPTFFYNMTWTYNIFFKDISKLRYFRKKQIEFCFKKHCAYVWRAKLEHLVMYARSLVSSFDLVARVVTVEPNSTSRLERILVEDEFLIFNWLAGEDYLLSKCSAFSHIFYGEPIAPHV